MVVKKPRVWRAPDLDGVKQDLFASPKKPAEDKPTVRVIRERYIGPHEGPKFQGRALGSYRRVELRRIGALVDLDMPAHWSQQEMLAALIDRMEALKELRDEFDS